MAKNNLREKELDLSYSSRGLKSRTVRKMWRQTEGAEAGARLILSFIHTYGGGKAWELEQR